MYDMLKGEARRIQDEVAGFAKDLVSTPSPSLHEAAVAAIIRDKVLQAGHEDVRVDGFGNVVSVMRGTREGPTVLLASHMDTAVPANAEALPAGGRIESGRLYGPGSADCKSGLAAQVFAGALLRRSPLPFKGNLITAATVADESGCGVGIRGLMEEALQVIGLSPDCAILGEPTNLNLYRGHDGWFQFDVYVEGEDRKQVEDAVGKICGELARRGSLGEPYRHKNLAALAPRFDVSQGLPRATIVMYMRLDRADDMEAILGRVEHKIAMVAGTYETVAVDIVVHSEEQCLYNGRKVQVRRVVNAWVIEPEHPLVVTARRALNEAGCEPRIGTWRLSRLGMGTAGSTLVGEFKVPTIGYGPGDESLAHTDKECVDIDKIVQAVYGTAVLVHRLFDMSVARAPSV